jgi:uncharacterized protein YbjT (DUF2867 family)
VIAPSLEERAVSTSPVLVTGAGGNVGAAVVAHLRGRGIAVRAGDLRRRSSTERVPDVETVRLDLTDPATFGPALDGVRRVFLIRPPAIARVGPTINAFVDAAAAAGVEHVVFSSVAGAEHRRIVPHHRVETHLSRSGMAWTMLRPGFFAQNLASAYRTDIRDHDRIHVPADDGRVAFVDTRDVGGLAATILAAPVAHAGRGYTLTCPTAVSFDEVAALLGEILGRPIRYEPATVLGYLRHLGALGLPVPQRVVQTVLHVGLRRGDAESVDPTLGRLLGRRPRDLATYVVDHRATWTTTQAVG